MKSQWKSYFSHTTCIDYRPTYFNVYLTMKSGKSQPYVWHMKKVLGGKKNMDTHAQQTGT
jgi:hypothetical protein